MYKPLFAVALALAAIPACKSHKDVAPDNTGRNQRDTTHTPTADQAVTTPGDLEITQKIRQALMDDRSLSMNAHNVKVVVQDGTVTLVGPVATSAEIDRIVQIATNIAGDRKVVNQLEVPDPPRS